MKARITDDEKIAAVDAVAAALQAGADRGMVLRAALLHMGILYGQWRENGLSEADARASAVMLMELWAGGADPHRPGIVHVGNDEVWAVHEVASARIPESDRAGLFDFGTQIGQRVQAGQAWDRALHAAGAWLVSWWPGENPWPVPAGGGGGARPVLSEVRLFGPRAIGGAASGPALQAGLSRFYHVWAMEADPDRVAREDDRDVAAGYDFKRVLLQVGSLDSNDYWAGRVANQNHPRHDEFVAGMLRGARDRGLRVSASIIGKGNGMDRQSARRDYVKRMAAVLREFRDVVLLAQVMNEPYAWGYITPQEALELERLFQEHAPGIPTSTGAHGLAEDCSGFEREAWGQVGTPHLDRDQTKSEMRDRPWRQPWDWGLSGAPLMNDEPIGPGASVAEERRATVLRSHALVSFVSRFFGYVFHADEGIRGHGHLHEVPGYHEVPRAKLLLPGDLPNGEPVRATTPAEPSGKFPQRHWTLPGEYQRADNGNTRGIVRVYGTQIHGAEYSVPFGPVSDFELQATRALRVECYQQDLGADPLWVHDVDARERVRFSGAHPDYLLVSRAR